ncbi:hypothetical protein H6G00_22450 [Leptolyngbya sp. FACHB-541]|uniref:hypothetical protein n=1 Tax=Leptolyngbya sp. FACHB-541 TaxID=2692810 RepID=UPI001688A2C3|nr:hypothetical protein [Leptolyngbya sp. FACHB-541]MBD1999337.1 hypothetical protein [Leptolyngbya sp. FACHB-541]
MKLHSAVLALGLVTLGSIAFNAKPALACWTPWTDSCDWVSDDILPEASEIDETILPYADIYVSNDFSQGIYVEVVEVINECDPSCEDYGYPVGTWYIAPGEQDVKIIDNASTQHDWTFSASSEDGHHTWDYDTVSINGYRSFTYGFY